LPLSVVGDLPSRNSEPAGEFALGQCRARTIRGEPRAECPCASCDARDEPPRRNLRPALRMRRSVSLERLAMQRVAV